MMTTIEFSLVIMQKRHYIKRFQKATKEKDGILLLTQFFKI